MYSSTTDPSIVCAPHMRSAFLLTISGQNKVTNWAIVSNHTYNAMLKYKEIKEIVQTNRLLNHLQEINIDITTHNGSFCN